MTSLCNSPVLLQAMEELRVCIARPSIRWAADDGLRAALCFFDFLVDRRFPELSVRTAVPEYL